ncbi:MAG: hypothetical protein J5822_03890 [Eubacteriaceae bacterium]|nr:hypothetical protein [Eubacteriaceae bacterium]
MKNRAECIREYGSDYFIRKKLESGELYLIEKGIYNDRSYVPELALLCYKYPNAVLTMDTAFYVHGLTDEVPAMTDMATDRDAAKIRDCRIRQFFEPKSFFRTGITLTGFMGYSLPVYDRERMLIELIRHQGRMSREHYKELIGVYRKLISDMDTEKLMQYASMAPKSASIIRSLDTEVF